MPEDRGGSGYSLEELVVVVEQFGRAIAPGPFVPTVIASAVLAAVGGEVAAAHLPGLADGSLIGAVALDGDVTATDGTVSGDAGNVLGGGLAQLLLVAVGDDVAVVEVRRRGDRRGAQRTWTRPGARHGCACPVRPRS